MGLTASMEYGGVHTEHSSAPRNAATFFYRSYAGDLALFYGASYLRCKVATTYGECHERPQGGQGGHLPPLDFK